MRLHWHRRDLRAADNLGLAAAAADGPVVPVFVFDRDVLAHAGPPRVAFMLDALDSLRSWYRERDSDLVVRHGDPREVLPALAESFDADGVTWGKEVSGLGRERDAAVRKALDEADVTRRSVQDALLHEPGSIRTNQGEVYSVFTYFWKKWRDRETDDPADPPTADDLADVSDDEPLPTPIWASMRPKPTCRPPERRRLATSSGRSARTRSTTTTTAGTTPPTSAPRGSPPT